MNEEEMLAKYNIKLIFKYNIKNTRRIKRESVYDKNGKLKPKRYMSNINAIFANKKEEDKKEYTGKGAFYDSLAALSQNDIELNETAKTVKKPSVDILRYCMLIASLAVFFYTGWQIAEKLGEYISAGQEYDALKDMFYAKDEIAAESEVLKKTKANIPIQDILAIQKQAGTRIVETMTVEDDEIRDARREEYEKQRVSFQKLLDKNKDLYGWIRVTYTSIDFPVVHRPSDTENKYYLKTSFEGNANSSGAIFVDYQNSRDVMENRNLVIYGHNMLDGSMFQPIIDFGKYKNKFDDGIIELKTFDEEGNITIYYYEIFSAREEDPNNNIYTQTDSLDEDEEWIEFLHEMKARSIFEKDVDFDADTRIITLSTCVNDVKRDYRFAIQGILIEVVNTTEEELG